MLNRDAKPDTTTMAKTQKTLFLPDEVCQLTQAYADKNGTTFSRVVASAILDHFFAGTYGPSPVWMTLTIPLERGDVKLVDVPKAMTMYHIEEQLTMMRTLSASSHPGPLTAYEEGIRALRARLAIWEASIESGGGGLKGVIKAATDYHPQARSGVVVLDEEDSAGIERKYPATDGGGQS